MRTRYVGLLSLFLAITPGLAHSASAQECGVPVMVHYCNWHQKLGNQSSWHTATVQSLYSDGFCVRDPKAPEGFDCFSGYRSLDRATVVHHNALMQANCLVPLISWWAKAGEHLEDSGDLFLDLYFSVPSPVKAGILYEVTERLQKTRIGTLPDGRPHEVYDFGADAASENAQRFIADVQYLNEKYIKRYPERMFVIDGRPVLFIWLSHAFHGRFDLAVAELRKTVPVYIIGSDFNIYGAPGVDSTPTVLNTVRGLDAVSAYSIYDGPLATKYGGHLSREYVDQYAMSVLSWNVWLREHAPKVKFIPPTMFTFDNRVVPVLDKTTPAEARYLATMARALIDQGRAGCTNVQPLALHVSLTEAFEGTSIEPTREWLEKIAAAAECRKPNNAPDTWLPPAECVSLAALMKDVFGPPLAPAPICPAP